MFSNPPASSPSRSFRDWIIGQLRAKLLASLALTFLLILIVDSFFTFNGRVAEIREQAQQFASTQIHSLQVYDYSRAGEELQSFVRGRGIGYAEIRDSQGVIVASWSSSSRWGALQGKVDATIGLSRKATGAVPMWLGKVPAVVYSTSIRAETSDPLGYLLLAYPAWDWMKDSLLRAAIVLTIFVLLLLRILRLIQTSSEVLVKPIEIFTDRLSRVQSLSELGLKESPDSSGIDEIKYLHDTFLDMRDRLKKAEAEKAGAARARALAELAAQVAHDIRSPLAALAVAAADASQLPEDKRILIRSAVGRIRDIANSLLEKNRAQAVETASAAPTAHTPSSETDVSPHLLSSLVDSLVTEKRLQYRSRSRVEIELRLESSSYGIFSGVQPVEFKRLLSNLIDNAVEAVSNGAGTIGVGLSARDDRALVMVSDDGKGIPMELLSRLGRRGETHGKEGGSGLGLHHARKSAESWGGSLRIASEVGKGTTVTVDLPQTPTPGWFVRELMLPPGKPVAILDDDASIHQIWQGRLQAVMVTRADAEIVHFYTPGEIRGWIERGGRKAREALYLLDYELNGYEETGLNLAEEMGIEERAVLVTSRYDEPEIINACRKLKIRMIPKNLAGTVPIKIAAANVPGGRSSDPVLIDDDPLARLTWKMAAERAGKTLRAFPTVADFLKDSNSMDRTTQIYVDAELGDGKRGDEEALLLHGLGFTTIYLATGHAPEKFTGLAHLTGVVGKDPPWT